MAQQPRTGYLVSDFVETVDNFRREMSERTAEMKEALGQSTDRVYHAITDNNRIIKFKIGVDGRLILDRTINTINFQRDKINEARDQLIKAGKLVPQRAAKRWRKVITGDPNKRIRDHMKEVPQVKKLDKFSFTLGVAVIVFTEYLIFREPKWFVPFYVYFMLSLFLARYFMYRAQKMQFYLLDFCYVVNLSCMLQTMFLPNNLTLFKMNYCLSMGPLCIAIILWNNSLVFHSLDKLTSFFLHAFPPVICHLFRWQLIPSEIMTPDSRMDLSIIYGPCLGIYISWQIAYLFLTERVFRDYIDSDPEIHTSLRYLTTNYKSPMNRLIHSICRQFKLIKRDELLRPDQFRTKVVFVTSQLAYMAVLIIPSYFLYTRYYWTVAYLIIVFLAAAWNGASYYIEVFSKRYNLKFERIEAKKASSGTPSEKRTDEGEDDEEYVEALEDLNESQTVELLELLESIEEHSDISESSSADANLDNVADNVSKERNSSPEGQEEAL